MPHAEDNSRPSSHSNGNANNSSSSGLGIRSKFRELGITSGGLSRNKLHSRSQSDLSSMHKSHAASIPSIDPSATKKQQGQQQQQQPKPLLPPINVDEFMPDDVLRRKAAQLRKELAEIRVSIQILEREKVKIVERRREIGRQADAARAAAEQHMQNRADKVDFWAMRLNRRRAGDAQMFQSRVARRTLTTRSQSSLDVVSSAGSVYSTDSFAEGEVAP